MKKENKRNWTILLFGIMITMFAGNLIGQTTNRREQIESQKVALITKQLNLTVEEAQKFWPVYNEFQQKKEEIIKKRRQMLKKLSSENPQLPDDQLLKLSDAYIKLQLDESGLASTYHEKIKAVLPIKKVVAYYKSEERFKRFLLSEVQKKRKTRR